MVANFSKERITIPEDLDVEGRVMMQHGNISDGLIDGFGAIVVAQ